MHERSPYRVTRTHRAASLSAVLCLTACTFLRSPTVPMAAVHDPSPPTAGARVLLVILPGLGDTPDELIGHGLVAMVRERGIAADVVVVDAHFGYYRTQQTVQRLWHDVIAPARSSGYDGVWIAGISIGGLGALLYGSGIEYDAPDAVQGVLSIAPYLGDEDLLEHVRAAGGLRAWRPPYGEDDFTYRLLDWLRGYGDASLSRPELYLGIGTDDDFFPHAQLVAPLLPPDHWIVVPGDHRWPPWLEIWGTMLDRAPLPRVVP